MSNIATIMKECRTSMEKGVEAAKREFSTVRTSGSNKCPRRPLTLTTLSFSQVKT